MQKSVKFSEYSTFNTYYLPTNCISQTKSEIKLKIPHEPLITSKKAKFCLL